MAKKKKVRLLTSIASADWSYAPGEEVEIESETADAWIESGIAEALEEEEENAAKRRKK